MKKLSVLFFVALMILLSVTMACDTGVASMGPVSPTGKSFSFDTGADLSFGQLSEYESILTEDAQAGYLDVNGAVNPINGQGLLTCKRNPDNPDQYTPAANPVVFDILRGPNHIPQSFREASFATSYTTEFRLTDDTLTYIDGTSQKNEPQGFIMAQIFLAGTDPNGALMLLIFPHGAFPHDDIKMIFNLGNPGLDENVFLLMNYDAASSNASGSLVAAAEYENIKIDTTPDLEDEKFNRVTLKVHDDAGTTVEGLFHGPTVSVTINGDEVIRYQNDGTSHTHGNTPWSRWDTKSSVSTQGDFWFAETVFQIAGGNDPDPQYFDENTGVQAWNDAWKGMIFRPSGIYAPVDGTTGTITDKIGFGATFQIGKNDDNPGYSKGRSPQIRAIQVTRD